MRKAILVDVVPTFLFERDGKGVSMCSFRAKALSVIASIVLVMGLCPSLALAVVASGETQVELDDGLVAGTSSELTLSEQGISAQGYIWPLKAAGTITTAFQGVNHKGIDISIGSGSDVVAAADGYVKYVQNWDGTVTGRGGMMSYGNLVIVYHPSTGTATYYAHLKDMSVSLGQQVSQYQVIGHVGSTGQSTGPHLHFELRLNAKSGQNTYGRSDGTYVNPLDYVGPGNLGPASANHSPEGYLDVATGDDGTIKVSGWALDRDNPSASIRVHVYVGGPAGSGEGHGWLVANKFRPDVNSARGVSGNHGFDATITTNKRGSVQVYAYGINIGGGENAQLINVKTVTVAEPAGNAAKVAEGTYAIRSKLNTNMGLDVSYRSTDDKANVALHDWNGGAHQKFNVRSAGDSAYYIVAQHSNKAVEVYGALTTKGANVSQYTQNQTNAQKWYFDKNGDGSYSLRNRASGLLMDVKDASTANGANIQQHVSNGHNAQKYYLVPTAVSRWSISVAQMKYTGKTLKPKVTVKAGGVTLQQGKDFSVTYNSNASGGKVIVKGINGFTGSATKSFKAVKYANPMKVSAKSPAVKASAVKSKAQSIAASKAFTVTKAKGKVTYKKTSGNAKITVSKAGKVTVKKGLKKGTYKVKVKVRAAGNAKYNALTKAVVLKVRVR